MTRRALATLAITAVVLAGLGAWQGPRFLDGNHYRLTVERAASAGLGRPVRIAGPIRLSLLPQATLRAGAVMVGDAAGGAGGTVGELRMQVGLGALLSGRVEPQDLVLQDARLHLPWPLPGSVPGATAPAMLHARVEGGTLLIGGLTLTAITGELSTGADGELSASGVATVWNRPWRMAGQLGRPGADGAATIAVSLDGVEDAGTGGALAGQMATDGSVSGRITGSGPDLSVLLPAPPQPWSADGRLVAGGGLVVADDLELAIGGSPSRGAVALRLLPELRLDAALAASRLDLDAWLPPLLSGGPVRLPTGIDLSAEAVPFAGGILRRLRAGFDLAGGAVTLRPSDVVLPGDAPLQVSGVFAHGQFDGSARVAVPDVPQTAAWLGARAPALAGAAPLGRLHNARLEAAVHADGATLAFGGLAGEVDGVPVAGTLALQNGPHPAATADLHLAGPLLDGVLPSALPGPPAVAASLAGAAQWAAGFDADVTVTADRPVWRGTVYDRLVLSGAVRAGRVDLRRAALSGAGLSVAVSGGLDPASRITGGKLALMLDDVARLAGSLPPGWQAAQPLLHGTVALDAAIAGPPAAWATVARLDAAGARVQLDGQADLPAQRWAGSVAFQHPGAPQLVQSVGWPALASWLGDGPLSGKGMVDATPAAIAVDEFTVSAGALHGTGALVFTLPGTGPPRIAGTLDIDRLPVRLPPIRSADPLAFGVLRTMDAAVAVHAAHLLWGTSPEGQPASARIGLAGGVLHLDDIAAHLAGGTLTGTLVVDAAGTPRVHAAATLSGAVLDGAVSGAGLDLVAGTAGGSVDIMASGNSPAALAASLGGTVAVSVRDGTLSGVDAGQVLAVLRSRVSTQAGVGDALRRGATPFTTLDAAGSLANGLLTLTRGRMEASAASIALSGSLDLPGDALDLTLGLHPALDHAPAVSVRLIGPTAAPSRTPALADLARWQLTQ